MSAAALMVFISASLFMLRRRDTSGKSGRCFELVIFSRMASYSQADSDLRDRYFRIEVGFRRDGEEGEGGGRSM
jgi:hypothetical protein